MQKYFISNRSVTGIVTINQEALDFGNKGFAEARQETYEAAKFLGTLGYKPYTEEEFAQAEPEQYKKYLESIDTEEHKSLEAAKKTFDDSEREIEEQKELLSEPSVQSILSCQVTLKEAIEGGDLTSILSAEDGLKNAWKFAEPKQMEGTDPDGGVVGEQGPDGSQVLAQSKEKQVEETAEPKEPVTEQPLTAKERTSLLRSAKQRLAQAKKRWDAEEDEDEKKRIEQEISDLEEEVKKYS